MLATRVEAYMRERFLNVECGPAEFDNDSAQLAAKSHSKTTINSHDKSTVPTNAATRLILAQPMNSLVRMKLQCTPDTSGPRVSDVSKAPCAASPKS